MAHSRSQICPGDAQPRRLSGDDVLLLLFIALLRVLSMVPKHLLLLFVHRVHDDYLIYNADKKRKVTDTRKMQFSATEDEQEVALTISLAWSGS